MLAVVLTFTVGWMAGRKIAIFNSRSSWSWKWSLYWGTKLIVIANKSIIINNRNLVFARIWIITFHFQRFYMQDLDKSNTKNKGDSRHIVLQQNILFFRASHICVYIFTPTPYFSQRSPRWDWLITWLESKWCEELRSIQFVCYYLRVNHMIIWLHMINAKMVAKGLVISVHFLLIWKIQLRIPRLLGDVFVNELGKVHQKYCL